MLFSRYDFDENGFFRIPIHILAQFSIDFLLEVVSNYFSFSTARHYPIP